MSNIQVTMSMIVMLILAVTSSGQSNSTELEEMASNQSNQGSSAISVKVSVTPVKAIDVDVVTFTFNVINRGTAELCNVTINNSLSGVVPVAPFDMKSGENLTITADYELTAEDRKLPYLLNWVSATAYSCEDGYRAAAASAGCTVLPN